MDLVKQNEPVEVVATVRLATLRFVDLVELLEQCLQMVLGLVGELGCLQQVVVVVGTTNGQLRHQVQFQTSLLSVGVR